MSTHPIVQRDGMAISESDIEKILESARDYAEGWFDGDADRLARSLHPSARKRAVADHASGALDLDELDIPPWLERVRSRGPVTNLSRDCDYVVLDVFRDLATCLVLSQPFMDYLHLARFGDRWLLVNVLYQEREGQA